MFRKCSLTLITLPRIIAYAVHSNAQIAASLSCSVLLVSAACVQGRRTFASNYLFLQLVREKQKMQVIYLKCDPQFRIKCLEIVFLFQWFEWEWWSWPQTWSRGQASTSILSGIIAWNFFYGLFICLFVGWTLFVKPELFPGTESWTWGATRYLSLKTWVQPWISSTALTSVIMKSGENAPRMCFRNDTFQSSVLIWMIRKLDGFPYLPRIKSLLVNNNRIVRVGEVGEEEEMERMRSFLFQGMELNLPNIHTLIMTNNSLTELADLEPLTRYNLLKTFTCCIVALCTIAVRVVANNVRIT